MSTGYTEPGQGAGHPGQGAGYGAADPAAGTTAAGEDVSLGERLGNVTRDLSTLMRQEVALAKAEVTQSATQAGKGVGMLAGAGIGAFFVLLFLSVSLWWAIGNGTGRGWAALIVAGIWAVIAAVLFVVGRGELKNIRGIPTTTDTLGKIPNAVKGKEEDNR